MTERSVVVTLKAEVAAFQAKMVAAGRTAETAFLASSKAAEKNRAALRTVGNAAGIMGAAAAAGVGIAIKSAADFDKAMSGVNAATHASAGEMERMRGLALKMGADTAFSATEAADGIEQLSKAGVSVSDVLHGGLKGALSLAAAGEIEVGDAAEAAASAMSQFGLKGKDVPHIADLLAAAAGKAQGEVGDFSMALNQSGLVANQTGLTIEETTGALAAFAHQGLIGSDAGTSLKTMLQSLTPNSENASKAMEALNISAYNQKGQFIGLEEWAGKLRAGLSNMSDEQRNATLKTVFGSDAVRAASVIYEDGAGGIGKWIDKVNDAGYAADTAARKQDNLAGDIEKLQGALSTLLIETGESGQGPLRSLTQGATDAVDALNGLPGPVKTAALAIGGLVAVTGGAAFLGSRFISAVAEGRAALSTLGVTADTTKGKLLGIGTGMSKRLGAGALGSMALAFNTLDDSADTTTRTLGEFINIAGSAAMGFSVGGPWGAAIGGAIGLVSAFAGSNDQAVADVKALTGTLDEQTGALTRNSREWVANRLQDQGAFEDARQLGLGLDTITEAALRGGPALGELQRKLVAVVRAGTIATPEGPGYTAQAQAAKELLGVLGPLNGKVQQSRRAWSQQQEAMGNSADATQKNTTFFGSLVGQINGPLQTSLRNNRDDVDKNADATETYADKVKELDAQLKSISAVLDKRSSIRAYQESLDAINKAIEENGKTLSANTPKGRANADALDAIASNAVSAADAMDNYRKKQQFLAAARQNYIDTAVAMGKNRDAAVKLANSIFGIPDKHTTKPDFDKHDADRDIDDYKKNIDGIPKDPTTKPKFDDGQARGDVNSFVDFFGGALGGIKDEQVKVQLSGLAKLALEGQGPLTRKFGGAIPGFLGTRGKDSVQAMLEPDEHVVTTAEVRAAGKGNATRGHRVWEGIRHAALVGALPDPMDLPAYAGGGAVTPRVGNSGFPSAIHAIEAAFNGVVDRVGEQLSDRINKMYRFGGGAPLGPGGNLSRGQIMMGQRFAQAQNGKPYIWGGVGPTGYDCSGYQSAIVNAALGRNPYQRIGSTSTMPWPGMMGGTGLYTIGWFTGDPGHTSGNIGGLGVESTGDHVRTGSAARSPLDSMFNHVGHYDTGGIWPNNTLGLNTSGGDEFVVNPRRFAEGGKVTKSERQANREERQARRDERAKQARQDATAFAHALKQFDFSHVEKMGRDDVRSELRDLRTALKDIFGKDAPILKTFDRLEHRMDKQARQQAKLVKSEESLSESLKSLKDKRDQYAASVAGTFRNDIFGGGLDDLSLQLRADTNDAQASRRALKLAAHKGLSGGLYAGLAASGNVLLEQQFAHLSRRQIARYEHLFASRQGATAALGRTAGAEVYGQRIGENSRALGRVHHRLGENTRQMRKLGRTIEKRVRRADNGAGKRARAG